VAAAAEVPAEAEPAAEEVAPAPVKRSRAGRRKKADADAEAADAPPETAPEPANDRAPASGTPVGEADEPGGPPRRGWWQRTFGP
jgi:ribonuclease E